MLQLNPDLQNQRTAAPLQVVKSDAYMTDKKPTKKWRENLNTGLLALVCEVRCSVHANHFFI